jgi:hypothetical protein
MSTALIPAPEQAMIAEDLAQYTHDPLGAVLYGFPWGEGELEKSAGPSKWQARILSDIGQHLQNPETRHQPCRIAVSSGNDIGKTALISMLAWWGTSTFEDCRTNITANTKNQLDTKTSPELAKWFRLALNCEMFLVNVTSIKVREEQHSQTWRIDLVPWSADNPAASAGLHNRGKRLLLVIDESSEIPAIIFETAEPVLLDADTEIIWVIFGNPTRNQGPFYDAVFGSQRHLWKHYVIDSRDVESTNKKQLQEWLETYGEDSDFFRVHARGLPPHSAEGQFIDNELVIKAQQRAPRSLPDDALVAGVDFAWGGSDDNVVRFRCGFDARSIPPVRVKGAASKDPAVMTGKLADVLTKTYDLPGGRKTKIDTLFFDSAGIAAPVESRLRALGFKNIIVVNFGADSPDPRCAYFRDFMWWKMQQWLSDGAIDKSADLAEDLAKPILVSERLNRIKLESKEDMQRRLTKLGLDSSSPDDGDALALTFAMPVAPKPLPKKALKPARLSAWS